MDYNRDKDIVVLGSFGRKVQFLDRKTNTSQHELPIVHVSGLTQIQFDQQDSNLFYSVARKDNLVYQWDIRNPNSFVKYFQRTNNTNQRMFIDNYKQYLAMGEQNGSLKVYDKQQGLVIDQPAFKNNVSNVIFHDGLLIGCEGNREFIDCSDDSSQSSTSNDNTIQSYSNTIKMFKIQQQQQQQYQQ